MKFYKISILISLVLTSLFFLISCEVTEPTKGLEVRLNSKSRETLVTGYVYDSNTLQPVEGSLTATFVGNNSTKIINETNENTTVFTIEDGIFVFGIKDGTEYTTSSPFVVNVVIEGNSYTTTNETLEIKKHGYLTKNFYVINPDNLPSDSDSDSFEAGETNNSGVLIDDVEYTTENGTTITMEKGTVLKNDNNSPVVGGLSSEVVVIPLTANNQYNAPQSITTTEDEKVNPVLKFDFNIANQKENEVDQFSQSAGFSIPIPDNLELPAGEIISLWKNNDSTGKWYKVGEATVSALSLSAKMGNGITAGYLKGNTIEAGNLLFGNAKQTCSATLEITNMPSYFNSTIQLFDNKGALVASENSSSIELDIPIEGITIKSIRINSELSDPLNTGVELGSNVNLVCGTNTTSLNFPTTLVNVRIKIQGVCTTRDPVIVVNPNITFSYKKATSSTWQNGNLLNGSTVLTGLEPAVYKINATYGDKSGTAEFEIINPDKIDITDFKDEENVLSVEVDSSTEPTTITMQIDLGDECD